MQISFEPKAALEIINQSKRIVVVTETPPRADAVCAMLAFYHAFKEFKIIRLVVPETVPEACFGLPESSVIEKDLGPKSLSINLDTNGVPLEKVSYKLEGKTFKLIIHPQTRSFDVERISYEFLGFSFDLFVFFGVKQIGRLAPLFNYDLNEVYKNVSLNIDVGPGNEKFAHVNLVEHDSTSVCDFFFKMLGYWKINFDKEVSLCLLTGLVNGVDQTNLNFSSPAIRSTPSPAEAARF